MPLNLVENLFDIAEMFEREGIDYALCGGLAVAMHGYPRFTKDIDFLIRKEDLSRAITSLKLMNFDIEAGILPFAVGTPKEITIYRISKVEGRDILTLDLILTTPTLESVWESRIDFYLEDRRLYVVSREGLLHMKLLAGREQDLLDLRKLGLLSEEDP